MPVFNREVYNISNTIESIALDNSIHVFLVNDSYDESAQVLLGKILASVKQDLSTASIHHKSKEDDLRLTSSKDILVLSFGLHPRQFQLQIDNRPYGLRKIGSTTYIFSRSLAELPNRPEERKALWISLKRYYGLS